MHLLYYRILDPDPEVKYKLYFTVTLVDDDPLYLEQMKDFLQSMKIEDIECFRTGEEFLAAVKEGEKRLIVCDFDFGSPNLMNGNDVLDEIRKRNLQMPVIMLSAQDKLTTAIETLMKGALDYFFKGTQNTFTSVFTSILKINEIQRMMEEKDDAGSGNK